jgi:hypothetical protein
LPVNHCCIAAIDGYSSYSFIETFLLTRDGDGQTVVESRNTSGRKGCWGLIQSKKDRTGQIHRTGVACLGGETHGKVV